MFSRKSRRRDNQAGEEHADWIGLQCLEGRELFSADPLGGWGEAAAVVEAELAPGGSQAPENGPGGVVDILESSTHRGFVATNPESGETRG